MSEKLQLDTLHYENYFDLGLIGMAVTSIEKGWLKVNDKLCEIFGYPKDELVKLTWAEITHPDDLAADVAQFDRVLSGEIEGYTMDKRFIRKDGNVIHASISVSCIRRDDGTIDHFVAFVQDITDRKNTEHKLQQLNTELEKVVAERTKELEEANRQLKIKSETDYLTQLPNRRFYERRVEENIATVKRNNAQLSLLLVDIDDFKAYNDKYGHDCGDIALQRVAEAIQGALHRDVDLVSRFGGEEFVVLLPTTDSLGALDIANRIRASVEAMGIKHDLSGGGLLTVSIGVESMKADTLNRKDLFKHADIALYQAKEDNKNCCRLYAGNYAAQSV